MNNKFIEAIKANKKAIIKRVLIIGGVVTGLAIVAYATLRKKNTDDECVEAEETKDELISSCDYSEEV